MDSKDKARIAELMRQADFHVLRFDKRREYSWKVALGFWGSILGAATLLGDVEVSPRYVCGAGVMIIGLHAFWLVNVFRADQKDKLVAFKSRDISLRIINKSIKSLQEKIEIPRLEVDRKALGDWSVLFQLGTTILLVASMGFLVLSS